MNLPLTSQCTSLELSERLRELGVIQDSHFYWAEDLMGGSETKIEFGEKPNDHYSWAFYSAFTCSELGELLPREIKGRVLTVQKCADDWWYIFYGDNVLGFEIDKSIRIEDQASRTESDARAAMLVYLLESGLLILKK